MLTSPFLTDLDPRKAVKGSRDPLGIQQIWTRLGRHVVGNLTTVSNSVRDFMTLLLGYYFAEELTNTLGPGTELVTFLKWEQLAAYSRATANDDWAFRGTERVRKNLDEGTRVTLSEERSHQILGNQKIYGLWGIYTMAARASALVEGDPARLSPSSLELVRELYLPKLAEGAGPDARRIRDLLRQRLSWIDVQGRDRSLIQSIGKILLGPATKHERAFYRRHLLHGGPDDQTDGRQQQLAALLDDTLSQQDFVWSPAAVTELTKQAKANGDEWHPLANRLRRIRTSETVVAPVSALFVHLLGLNGKTIASITKRLDDEWGNGLRTVNPADFGELRDEIGHGDVTTGDRWVRIAETLSSGDFATLIDLLIVQNKSVMEARGGSPWLETRNGKLNIRFQDEQGSLPNSNQLSSMWRFPYFLDSLRSIAATLKEN